MLVLEETLLQPYSVGILVSLEALLALSVVDPTTYRSLLPSSLGQSRLDVAHAGGRFRYRLYSFMDAGGNLGWVAVVVLTSFPFGMTRVRRRSANAGGLAPVFVSAYLPGRSVASGGSHAAYRRSLRAIRDHGVDDGPTRSAG